MDFNALRAIIKNIRSQVTCPHCENSYANEDLSVVSAIDNRCVLLAQCNHCSTPILITAAINEPLKGSNKARIVTEKRLLEEVRDEEVITPDDVLKIHELLKDYKGDLEQLFKGADKKE
ncbi:MAG: hypothetical protein PHU71_00700 [Candidatus Gracilibacteria bacterium]|nr:hypothetical protein [Candidatus Gracilibacteria bacterium]